MPIVGKILRVHRNARSGSSTVIVEVEVDDIETMAAPTLVGQTLERNALHVVDIWRQALRESYAPHAGRTMDHVRR